MNFLLVGLSPSTSGSREMPWRCKQRCSEERVRHLMVACKAHKQSSSGSSVCFRKATIMDSSSIVRTVDFGFLGPVGRSETLNRFFHFGDRLLINAIAHGQ